MTAEFEYFVILAGMRTGSNLLEESLNAFPDIQCYGEVFNPAFVGHANKEELFGMRTGDIAADPDAMIEALKSNTDGIPGFRLFRDHNEDVLQRVLADHRCAKIILKRNPVESYVSLEIVRQTNQWRMNDLKKARTARATYVPAEFASYLGETRAFYDKIRDGLHAQGQAAFELDYADLRNEAPVVGAARYIGSRKEPVAKGAKAKKQNPGPLSEKVSNYAEMVSDLLRLDPLSLYDEPNFEPDRGGSVQNFLAADRAGLLFQPIKSAVPTLVLDWLTAVNDDAPLSESFNQKALRRWKRERPGHRAFTVVRHPVERAFHSFLTHFVEPGPKYFTLIADALKSRYGVPLPDPVKASNVEPDMLQAAFLSYLKFVKGNLAGQTSIRVDGAWATQAACLAGMSAIATTDRVLRENELHIELPGLAALVGIRNCPEPVKHEPSQLLMSLYDSEIEEAARAAYARDYMMFGWSPLKNQDSVQ